MSDDSSRLSDVITWSGALMGAVMARKALTMLWVQVTGDEPPDNPAARGTTWRDALLWGAAAGLVAGLSRTAGRKLATGAYASLSGTREEQVA